MLFEILCCSGGTVKDAKRYSQLREIPSTIEGVKLIVKY